MYSSLRSRAVLINIAPLALPKKTFWGDLSDSLSVRPVRALGMVSSSFLGKISTPTSEAGVGGNSFKGVMGLDMGDICDGPEDEDVCIGIELLEVEGWSVSCREAISGES